MAPLLPFRHLCSAPLGSGSSQPELITAATKLRIHKGAEPGKPLQGTAQNGMMRGPPTGSQGHNLQGSVPAGSLGEAEPLVHMPACTHTHYLHPGTHAGSQQQPVVCTLGNGMPSCSWPLREMQSAGMLGWA